MDFQSHIAIAHLRYIFKNSNMTPRQNYQFLRTPLPRNPQKSSRHKENQTKYRTNEKPVFK